MQMVSRANGTTVEVELALSCGEGRRVCGEAAEPQPHGVSGVCGAENVVEVGGNPTVPSYFHPPKKAFTVLCRKSHFNSSRPSPMGRWEYMLAWGCLSTIIMPASKYEFSNLQS